METDRDKSAKPTIKMLEEQIFTQSAKRCKPLLIPPRCVVYAVQATFKKELDYKNST